MKIKIILSNFFDYLLVMIISGLCLIPFSVHLFGLISSGEVKADLIPYYLMTYFLAFILVFMLINIAYRLIIVFITKGKSLGRYLVYLKLVDINEYPNDIKTLAKRELLIVCLLNYVTLYLFNLVELIRVLSGKESLTNKWCRTKYIIMEDDLDGTIY